MSKNISIDRDTYNQLKIKLDSYQNTIETLNDKNEAINALLSKARSSEEEAHEKCEKLKDEIRVLKIGHNKNYQNIEIDKKIADLEERKQFLLKELAEEVATTCQEYIKYSGIIASSFKDNYEPNFEILHDRDGEKFDGAPYITWDWDAPEGYYLYIYRDDGRNSALASPLDVIKNCQNIRVVTKKGSNIEAPFIDDGTEWGRVYHYYMFISTIREHYCPAFNFDIEDKILNFKTPEDEIDQRLVRNSKSKVIETHFFQHERLRVRHKVEQINSAIMDADLYSERRKAEAIKPGNIDHQNNDTIPQSNSDTYKEIMKELTPKIALGELTVEQALDGIYEIVHEREKDAKEAHIITIKIKEQLELIFSKTD